MKQLPEIDEPEDKKLYLECECHSKDHMAVFACHTWPWKSDDGQLFHDVNLYLDVQMRRQNGFFKRLWTAVRYVFKSTPCDYGYWNNIMISQKDAKKIIEICNDFLQRIESNRK